MTPQLTPSAQLTSAPPGRWMGGHGLTTREQEVLALLPTWLLFKEIAGRLYISENTVKCHTRSIYQKLGVTSRREAVARSHTLGLMEGTARGHSG